MRALRSYLRPTDLLQIVVPRTSWTRALRTGEVTFGPLIHLQKVVPGTTLMSGPRPGEVACGLLIHLNKVVPGTTWMKHFCMHEVGE